MFPKEKYGPVATKGWAAVSTRFLAPIIGGCSE